ncbi:MAG: polysaccharide deacetylase family protein [Hyphomicrobiaceae bacterium]|nr:polysaccharide deacetylase family protein [Hyphomicrobiaceae bacterium]
MRRTSAIVVAAFLGLLPGAPASAQGAGKCLNANALGVGRTVEIDTAGGPGFGMEQYKAYDFLNLKEVVLTFDDGPWPNTTRAVLEALAKHCTKATFFPIGKHAMWHPEILKDVAAAGHTVGSHTWSHANLAKAPAKGKSDKTADARMTEELEKGFSAVKLAIGQPPQSFFRFPFLKDPKEALDYLGKRNVAVFSHDLDSFDFKMRKPDDVVKSVMNKLDKKGKGIILMHDLQQATANAMPSLLDRLKAEGYKVVHMRSKQPLQTLPEYDEALKGEIKGVAVTGGGAPVSSIVRTVDSEDAPAADLPAKSAKSGN